MKPAPFKYIAPTTIDDTLATLAEYGDDARLLAGGQSLIPAMNFRLARPAVLVDLNGVAGLDHIRVAADGALHLGAMARQSAVERQPDIARHAPLLAETLPFVAHPQIRNRGTIGGSLAHADPAAELPVIAVARDARLHLRRRDGERWVAAGDFYPSLFTTALAADEMLVEILFPPWPPRTGGAFIEVARRHGDYALVGVSAVVTLAADGRCQEARLTYLNAGDVPVVAPRAADLLRDTPLDSASIAAAADLAATEEMDPTGDIHAAAGYKRHLARVLTERALASAHGRATAALEQWRQTRGADV